MKVVVLHLISFHDVLLTAFWEVTLLHNIGLTGVSKLVNSPTWFLCATLLGSYLIYFLLQKCRGFFLHFIAPFSVIFTFCYFNQLAGKIELPWSVNHIVTHGMIRGFMELSLGCLTYMAYQYCRKFPIKQFAPLRTLQSLLELGAIGLICLMCYREGETPKDFILVMIFSILIISASLGSSALAYLCNRPVVQPILVHMGKLSYIMFLSHVSIVHFINRYLIANGYLINTVLFLAITIILAEIIDIIVRVAGFLLRKTIIKRM